ncbi:hypothetical protein ACFX2A_006927 [Malus domestica]
MDLDLALREEEPEPLTDVSTAEQRLKHEKWEKANRMSLMVMKRTMSETVRGGIVASEKAKDFLEAIGAKYRESEKAEMGNLMTTLTTLKFEENKSVREHILKLVETASKLKDLEVPVDDAFVGHMALNSLPSSFEQLKVSYNTQKEKWTLDDLISICAQEEARIKKNQMINHVNFMQTDVGKKPMYQHGKIPKPFNSYDTAMNASSSKGPEMSKKNMDNVKCYFYKRFGHMKKDCEKRKNWKIKKVENQLDLSIKVLRSDRGGEYYGRYTEIGQAKGHLAVYLEQCGIQAQYTSPGTPQQNGVAERRNRTLIEMVRSMMSRTKLPQYLWGEALQMANYILNRVPTKAVSKTPYEVWIGRKPSLNHLHIWGCRAEARVYNPREKKLDSRTISCHFVGFPEKTKGYRFYSTDFPMRIFETGVAKFIEEGECSLEPDMEASRFNLEETGNVLPDNNIEWFDNGGTFGIQTTENDGGVINITQQQIEFNIDNFDHSMSGVGLDFHAGTSSQLLGGLPGQQVRMENSEQHDIGTSSQPTRELIEPQATTERRILPARTRKSAISSDYVVYLQEIEMCEGMQDDPVTFYEAMETQQSNYWRDAMIDELRSMQTNNVWTLVEAPLIVKPIGCKWVFKTKRDLNGKVESLRIILSLVAHYDLELHQMDVKTAFLNGELEEEIYMQQPMGFVREGQENMVCKLNKSIYGLKQASRQWFMKFDQKVTAMGFIENKIDDCIYVKVCGSKFVFLILYVDDILLASNCMNMLLETKGLLSKTFEMKDMGNASFVLGIEIVRNRSKKLLGLSQKSYIEKVLQNGEVPMGKGDRLNKSQCPKNELEKHGMSTKPYASLVGSLMYAQVCTRPDLAFAISVLGRYQANPGEQHWVAAKKVLRYLQRTKSYMLVYRSVENLELVGYTDSDFAGCLDDRKSTSGYVFTLGGAAVSWKSVKQKALATSTMEAEFIALFEATKKGLWLKNLITFMRLVDSISRPLVIHCDNKAAVFFSKNNKKSEATRLMDVKYLSVKEHVKKGDILVEHIDTQRMIADPLTKPLAVGVFKEHITSMGFHESFDSAGLWE